ncbi:MAG TPA: cadmium-translocating P-type ATPase [Firmicutes bacterium]|nr:cadmium-translocating P-type ATPase [Bacillota bacterium]
MVEETRGTNAPAVADHGTGDEEGKGKRDLLFVGIAGLLLVVGLIFNAELHGTPHSWAEYLVLIAAYLLVGGRVLATALRNLVRGEVFDESFLMSVATIGAIAIHQLPEAVAVMLFYSLGEYLQDRAVDRSRRSIAALLNIRPDYANLKMNGDTRKVSPEEVAPGQIIIVRPGERVPLDGEVIEGSSLVDTSALTGESVPRKVEAGRKVLAGMINGQGLLTVRVTKTYGESSAARILDLVEKAAAGKAPTEQFITSFSRYYTPIVVLVALGLAIAPPLFIPGATFGEWVYRALVLLVISCPCALVISIPLSYFGGIGGASRQGILVKGANFLETLTCLHTVVFDKTGTLTKGVFRVAEVATRNGFSKDEVLRAAALAEAHSNHPMAKSILDAYRNASGIEIEANNVREYQEIAGHGVKARVNGKVIVVGNDRLMHRENIPHDSCDVEGTVVYVAMDGVFAGYIIISDEIKPDAPLAVRRLKDLGIKRVVMLTGDDEGVAKMVSSRLGIDEYFAELLPQDKVRKLEELEASLPGRGRRRMGRRRISRQRLAFVGDGINDAPVITRADVGVAMGGLGSDAAIEAADVVIMEDAPSRVATAIEIARRTSRIARQNVILALGVKAFFLVIGAWGLATMWEAVFADVGVTLIAVFNALRAVTYRAKRELTLSHLS